MKHKLKKYTIIAKHDGKWFYGKCKEVKGAITQGKTLRSFLINMEEAIGLVELDEEDRLNAKA